MKKDSTLSLKETTQALQHKNILAWIVHNNIKTETGADFDFRDHRYLIDIYLDKSKYLACLKAGQIGFSSMAVLKTLWMSHYEKLEIGYILPTVEMVQKFVGSKVNRMCQQNQVLSNWTKDKDSITQKQIGESFIFYLGAMTDRSAIMITLDMLVADEYDKAPQEILEIYDSRLQHSKYGYKWVFSNPTIPEYGVDKFWRQSDQKKWHITHKCGRTYILDEACIDYAAKIFRCPSCREEITDDERRMGSWKATAVGEWSGYWIPLWLNTMHSAAKIAEYKRTKTPEYFSNYVAGTPYTGSGNKVMASTIIKCITPKVNDQTDRIIIGVDTGLPIHYVLSNKQGYFFYGKCSDPSTGKDPYDELDALMRRFPNSIMVSDQGGDLIGIRKLQAKYPGRVFLAWYRSDRKTMDIFDWGKGIEYGRVFIDRNRAIQWFVDQMTDKRVNFNGSESDWQEYISHWLNIYRTWEKDERGDIDKTKGFKWERNGPDHFCFVAGTKITTNEGYKDIEEVKIGNLVLTRNGYRKVVNQGLTKVDTTVMTSYFSNGSILISTPEHPFITQRGKERIDSITRHAIMYSCLNQKVLFTKGLLTEDTQIHQEENQEFITSQTAHFDQKDTLGFISRYGLIPMALSLRVFAYTIKTVTHLIMIFQTWTVNRYLNTSQNILTGGLTLTNTGKEIKNTSILSDILLQSGENQKKAGHGIVFMPIKLLYFLNLRILTALSAVLKVLHKADVVVSSVPHDVVIVGSHGNIERKDVINLTVEDEHEYFANDILVSNCHATIYASAGLDKYAEQFAKIVGGDVFGDITIGNPEGFRLDI